ncbi:unnamed protein product [Rotaria sp. Silwood2]|nr:unnamed protein product [Rotaria sp. Silwood2]
MLVILMNRDFYDLNFCWFLLRASSYENPPRATQYQSTKRFDNLQADVNQVVDVMKDNLDKVLERDAKLSTLENRAEILETGASQFTTNASKLKRKYWWKNVKNFYYSDKLMYGSEGFHYSAKSLQRKILRENIKMWIILIIVIIVLIIVIVGNGALPAAAGSSSKQLTRLQADAEELTDIMRQNVDKILDREKDLQGLVRDAEKLGDDAAQFQQNTEKLQDKQWWKNFKNFYYSDKLMYGSEGFHDSAKSLQHKILRENKKMWIILIIVIIILIIVIVVAITQSVKSNKNRK